MNETRWIRSWTFSIAALSALSCSVMPDMPPREAAADIAEKIDTGDLNAADRGFAAIRRSERHREVAFSVLFELAQSRYEQPDYEGAIRLLRFLNRHYARAGAPKEGLLYALFLERASKRSKLDAETAGEMLALLKDLRARDAESPVWLDLIAAQIAIDRGHLQTARDSLARFRAKWRGRPAEISQYVTEIERFLSTHGEDSQ